MEVQRTLDYLRTGFFPSGPPSALMPMPRQIFKKSTKASLVLALKPEWESKFEPNSYGFRPGHFCQDAISALFVIIAHKARYVIDADLRGVIPFAMKHDFDNATFVKNV